MRALIIARYTILESLRRRVLLALAILSLAYIALFAIGFSLLHQEVVKTARGDMAAQGATLFSVLMTVMGFWALSFLTSLMAIFASAGALSGEIESGVIHAVLAKPLRRSEVVLGKWLGQAVVLVIYVALMTAGMVAASQFAADYSPPQPELSALYLAWSALVLLTLGTLGGTFMPTLTNGVAVFLLFGLSRAAGLIESIGTMLKSHEMVNVGVVVSLLIPTDALWQAASYYLQPPLALLAGSVSQTGLMPFAWPTPPTTAMQIWAAGYILVALIGAILVFSRRDL